MKLSTASRACYNYLTQKKGKAGRKRLLKIVATLVSKDMLREKREQKDVKKLMLIKEEYDHTYKLFSEFRLDYYSDLEENSEAHIYYDKKLTELEKVCYSSKAHHDLKNLYQDEPANTPEPLKPPIKSGDFFRRRLPSGNHHTYEIAQVKMIGENIFLDVISPDTGNFVAGVPAKSLIEDGYAHIERFTLQRYPNIIKNPKPDQPTPETIDSKYLIGDVFEPTEGSVFASIGKLTIHALLKDDVFVLSGSNSKFNNIKLHQSLAWLNENGYKHVPYRIPEPQNKKYEKGDVFVKSTGVEAYDVLTIFSIIIKNGKYYFDLQLQNSKILSSCNPEESLLEAGYKHIPHSEIGKEEPRWMYCSTTGENSNGTEEIAVDPAPKPKIKVGDKFVPPEDSYFTNTGSLTIRTIFDNGDYDLYPENPSNRGYKYHHSLQNLLKMGYTHISNSEETNPSTPGENSNGTEEIAVDPAAH